MIMIIIESTKRRGATFEEKDYCLTRIGHILLPMSPNGSESLTLQSWDIGGSGGAAAQKL